MTVLTLDPKNKWEFLTAMSRAWEWAQRRKRFYAERGGEQTVLDYIRDAQEPDVKQLAVTDDAGAFCAVLTVELTGLDVYDIHVTTAKNADRQAVLAALLWLREELFERRDARELWTSCGTYRGHKNRASHALAEACGMTPSGIAWEGTAPGCIWQEYSITREQYDGIKSNN